MAPKSVTFRRHDHLVSVLFGDLLSHSYNITFSMFLDLVFMLLFHDGEQKTRIFGVRKRQRDLLKEFEQSDQTIDISSCKIKKSK